MKYLNKVLCLSSCAAIAIFAQAQTNAQTNMVAPGNLVTGNPGVYNGSTSMPTTTTGNSVPARGLSAPAPGLSATANGTTTTANGVGQSGMVGANSGISQPNGVNSTAPNNTSGTTVNGNVNANPNTGTPITNPAPYQPIVPVPAPSNP